MRTRKPLNAKLASSKDGFAIPIALGFGMIFLLLATTAVLKAQNDGVTAVNKKMSAQSLVAAETGVARIQDFLNRNRAAASAVACAAPASPFGSCPDTGTTVSWKVPVNITNLCTSSGSSTVTSADTSLVGTNNWQNAVTGDDSKGKFRIVSYTGGVLTVEGILNQNEPGEARSRLQATIPVSDPTQEQVSSLWVTGSISGSPQIDSDVVGSCTSTHSVTFPSGTQHSSIKTSQSMPAVKPKPTSGTFYSLSKISTIPGNTLPRTTSAGHTSNDVADSDGIYKYIVTDASVANPFDGEFRVTPGAKVWLWVKGNIDLSNRKIVNQCGSTASCGPLDVRIYPEGTGTGTLTLNKGTAVCDVFFHLPNHSVTYNDAGTVSTQDCGLPTKDPATAGVPENTGVYWVASWTSPASLAGKTLIDAPRAYWSTAIAGTGMTKPALSPQIGPVNAWQTQSN